MNELRDIVEEFDALHVVKQIILIGEDGAVKNIEIGNEVVEE